MNETATPAPTAVPQNAAAPVAAAPAAVPAAAPVAAPAATNALPDPALDLFAKVAAERRTRAADGVPWRTVPFGTGQIRIYSQMPANWAYLAASAEQDPAAAFAAIREAIIVEDRAEFDRVRQLPPDNAEGIDGEYLVGFLSALGSFYGGVPTPAS